jgi:hypothetical protein
MVRWGSLRITYTDDEGDEGDGYIGTIADAELHQKMWDS